MIWLHSAEAELAALWMAAHERPAITEAADEIDRQLRRDAKGVGESREPGWRILLVPPLGVKYTYSEPDRTVFVTTVWRYR